MPRVKAFGTRWREPFLLDWSDQAVSCDECGRPDLRVAYRCWSWPVDGRKCQRNRCWKCAEVKIFYYESTTPGMVIGVKSESLARGPTVRRYVNVKKGVCKACRAEDVLLSP